MERGTSQVAPSSILHPPSSLLAALLAIVGFIASAEEFGNMVVKDFPVVLEYHKAPHETQTKLLLHGDEAEPHGGLVLIRGMTLQLFGETGELQMLVQAPQCTFDTVQHTVSSTGHLEVQSGDGQFLLTGEGFSFQQTNKVLIISNRVQTVLRSEPKKASKQ